MAGLHFDITGDNSNFLRKLDEARNGVRSTSKQIEESGMSIEQMFGRMAKGAAAFGAGITAKEIVSSIVRVRGEFQQLEVAFNTMLGSEQKATSLMQQLVKTAATTPFDLQSVANGAKQLLAYGDNVENVNDDLIRLGNIASGLSQPLNDLVYLYGTTMTQGRLYTQDFNQFTGRGIPMIKELAKQFGVAEGEVKGLVEAGKVGFPEVQKVIQALTNEGGMFYNLMEKQSKTITGQISNIKDSISTMYNNLGKSSEGFINDALSGVSYLVENYEQVGKTIMELAATYGVYKAVLMSVAAYQSVATGITYSVEIAELSKLIPLKQQSVNEDVIAAVASGKLTQSKAEQVIALRAEIAAKIQSLQATKAQAQAEFSSALATYKASRLRYTVAQEQVALAQSQMSIAIKSGTVEEIAAAKKNAQTASLELNNAAVAKNTAHKGVNIAATNSKSASEALNTVQTGLNTVSQNTNTISTNILTAAKTKLAAASKALGLSMLANPYVLVAAAVAGLCYGIYKLTTYQTDAEKAQSKLNDTVKEFNNQTTSENAEINRLFDKLRNTSKETSNYQKTKDEIIKKYGSYLEGLNQEVSKLNDVEAAYRAISTAARQAAADRAITKATQEAQDDWAENRGNVIEKLKGSLTSGGKMTDGAAEAFIETINRELKETGRLSDETTKKIEKYNYTITHLETGEIIGSGNSILWAVDALKKNDKILDDLYGQINSKFGVNTNEYESLGKADIDAYIKGFESALSNFKKTGNKQTVQLITGWVSFGSEEELELQLKKLRSVRSSFDKNNSTDAGKKTASDWLSSYKKAYIDADKAYNDFLKSKQVMSEVDRDKELERLKGLRDTAKKTYEEKGGSASSDNKQDKSANTLRQQQEKLALLLDQQKREAARMKTDSQHELEQIEINVLVEGSEKVLRQRALNHEKELEAIKREAKDKKSKAIEEARSAFEANPANAKKTFDVKKDFTDLQPTKDLFASFDKIAEAKTKTENTKYNRGDDFKGLLDEYQDYTDKRLAIETKYNNDLATLEEQRKQAVKNGDTQQVEQIDRTKAQATKNKGMELMGLDYEQLKESPEYVRVFENLKETSSETLNSLLSQLENAKGAAAKVLSPDQLREYTTTIQEIMDELDSRNPFQSLSDKKQELAEAEQELAQAQIELENARQTAEAVKGGAKIENGVKSSKLNPKTGKNESTKAYLTESQALEKVKTKTNEYNAAKDKTVKASSKVKKSEEEVKNELDGLFKAINDVGNSIGGPAGEIISLIGDIGTFTMTAMSGVKAAADTSATAISTVEKASVILAIISAAFQIAMKIASLFNNDEEYQKEIERLQGRIEQLQWELDNADAIRLQNNSFQALQKVKEVYAETTEEVLKLHLANDKYANGLYKMFGRVIYNNEIMRKSAEKLAVAYANIDYTADKALGTKKYSNAKAELENIAQQQLLIQEQIRNEDAKKKTDHGKIEDWERQIQELGEKANAIINEIVEEIIGGSASDIATELGDAFIEAFQSGENAAEAWGDKVNDIVANVLKRMLISKYLEEPLGEIFDKYKSKWYKDGEFAGIDAIMESMGGFANDLNAVGSEFQTIWDALPDNIKNMFTPDDKSTSQSSTSGGFETMSQDTGSELNGRFTALQISNEEIKNSMLSMLSSMNLISVSTNTNGITLTEIRNIALMSNSHLENISKHTKTLLEVGGKLDRIESNTKGLISR